MLERLKIFVLRVNHMKVTRTSEVGVTPGLLNRNTRCVLTTVRHSLSTVSRYVLISALNNCHVSLFIFCSEGLLFISGVLCK